MVYDRCYFMKAQAYNWNKRSNDFVNYKDVMMQIADIYHKNELNYDYLITLEQIIDEAYRANNISGAIGIFPISRYEKDIREILTNVEEIMVKFIGYPQLAEVHLRLSYDYLCLQDHKNAERHLDYFNSLRIPLLSMDYHSREMYKALNEALNRQS